MDTTLDRSTLEQKLIPELQRIAQDMGIEGTQRLRKAGLIDAIVAGGNGGSTADEPAAEFGPAFEIGRASCRERVLYRV